MKSFLLGHCLELIFLINVLKIRKYILKVKKIQLEKAKRIWDDYHGNTYSNIRDYCRKNNLAHQTVSRLLGCYIPNYSKFFKAKSKNNQSNKQYVGKYDSEP